MHFSDLLALCARKRHHGLAVSSFRFFFWWCLLLFLLGGLSSIVSGNITYSTENLLNPSLYQSVTFSILSNPLAQDPPITTNDEFYLISTAELQGGACSFSGGTYTTFSITSVSAGGYTGTTVVPITPEIVTEGSRYVICFFSASTQTVVVVYRGFTTPTQANSSMLIYPALYDEYTLSPTISVPTAGAGPVGITIPQVTTGGAVGRPLNLALTGSQTVLLISCPTASDCASGASALLVENCAAQGAYFQKNPSSRSADIIPLSNLKVQESGTLFGTFVVPYVPSSAGYTICVPYCVSLSCTNPSFALLAPTSSAALPLIFGSANPKMYTRTPSMPQAREIGIMTITGEGLSAGSDQVTMLTSNATDCSTASSSGELLPNMFLGNLVQGNTEETVNVSFEFQSLISSPITGLVCYYLAFTQLWNPVFLNPTSDPTADFTIDVLQPQSFTVFPAMPVLGSTIKVTFLGTGLNSEKDLAFLTASTSSNLCTTDSDENASNFACEMSSGTGGSTATPVCAALVNTDADEALQLRVCYQKDGTSNYALLGQTISIAARTPVFTVSSSPIYAGEAATIQFVGAIETTDIVKLTESNAQCSSANEVSSVSLLGTGTLGQYMVVGQASSCVQVCYFTSSSSMWVISAPSEADRVPENSICDSNNLYIAPFPLRYTIQVDKASLNGGLGLTVNEVAIVAFTIDSSVAQLVSSIGSTTVQSLTLSAAKVVKVSDACVTTFCNNVGACSTVPSDQDYVSDPYGTSQQDVNLVVHTSDVNYVLCAELNGMAGVYIPVLPSSVNSPTDTTFGFSAEPQNPVLGQLTPSIWRAWMSEYMGSFTGKSLSSSTDKVYAFGRSSVPYESSTVVVCPTSQAISAYTPLLTSSLAASNSSTTTAATFSNGANLYNEQVLYLCYLWSSGSTQRMTFVSSITIAGPSPSSYVWEDEPTNGFLAGNPVSLLISSNATILTAVSDSVYFYRFLMESSASTCFCSASTCSTGTLLNYLISDPNETMLTQVNLSAVRFTRSVGFDNYGYAAYYVTCYTLASVAPVDSYLGLFRVGMGDPTFYTVSILDGSSAARVGALLQITAVNRCRASSCPALTAADSLLLAPSFMTCASLKNSASVSNYSSSVGDPTVSGGITFTQNFVPLRTGSYRVCFRSNRAAADTGKYSELPAQIGGNSNNFQRVLIPVQAANPSAFTSFPLVPSAGELLTISMECTASQCSSCQVLRIVPGSLASCWETDSNSYSSSSCLNTTSYLFPEIYLSSGNYTLCFGGTLLQSSRIPGTLKVTGANPSSYNAAEGNGTSILVDQSANYVVDITGTSLSQQDTAFFITKKGLTCHQLRNKDVVMSGILGEWLLPSVSPYPLTGGDGEVQWLVSNREKRFGAELLLNTTYCPGDNENCGLTLCYQRAGRSWAPVASASNQEIDVIASNPASAEFDQYPLVVNMYTMVTVKGTGLQQNDTLVIYSSRCESETPVSVSVAGLAPVVADNGLTWRGVIRLTGTAETYAVCYTRTDNKQVVEIVMLRFPSNESASSNSSDSIIILSSPLYYLLSPNNFTEPSNPSTTTGTNPPTIYEELQVQATFVVGGSVTQPLIGGELILNEDECNYPPFSVATGSTETLPVISTLELLQGTTSGSSTAVYQARLYLSNDDNIEYALCFVLSGGKYFRVTESATAFSEGEGSTEALVFNVASPATYQFTPPFPSIGQYVEFEFSSLLPSTSQTVPMLAVGDVVEVIDGSLFECGFHNSTLLAGAALTSSSSTNSTSIIASASVPLAFVGSLTSTFLTVCYRKVSLGGTFATVPLGALIDKNFQVVPLNPIKWTISPRQAVVLQPLSITFYPLLNSETASFNLTSSDVAFLVEINAGEVTTAEERNSLCQSGSPALSSSGKTLVIDTNAGTSMWSISAMPSEIQMYVVCYRAQQNSMAISYVDSPATLQLYPPESPTGVYTNRGTNTVFLGERFFLFFNTTTPLNVGLESDQSSENSSTESKDLVRFSTTVDCSTSVPQTYFQAIPESFGFKKLTEYNSNGILIPYLNLRSRPDVGSYYVCMKRANQDENQYYYDYNVIGGPNSPSKLEVFSSPLQDFSTAPTLPRALVPDTIVSFAFNSSDVLISSFTQMFFVLFSGSANDVGNTSSELLYDDCYRPTSSEAESSTTTVVSTTLQVTLSNQKTEFPYPSSGIYLLCYQFQSSNSSDPYFFSSVYPAALTVLPASPTSYTVPQEMSISRSFIMNFNATDSIFTSSSQNKAQIFSGTLPDMGDASNAPSCVQGTIPEGGDTTFTSFQAETSTYASVTPTLEEKGYYYVCFLTDGQLNMLPVPNSNGGGYYFSVGVFGPQSYTVEPVSPFLGASATLIISGSMLSAEDKVKIVEVANISSSTDDLSQLCTPSAPNVDSTDTDSSGVAVTPDASAMHAVYKPRLNVTGTFILCYKSKVLGESWYYISPVESFTVQSAHPSSYIQNPLPSYGTAINRLLIYDTRGLLAGVSNKNLKLITRTTSNAFDCTETALQSPLIGLLSYQQDESSDELASFAICATAEASVTVCFQLPVEGSGWAEVPFTSPPPSYDFRPAQIASSPFQSPPVVVPSSPRPFATFTITIDSLLSTVEATFVSFAPSPQPLCASEIPYVSPTFYAKSSTATGAFQVALPKSGSYHVYVGTGAEWSDPNVTLTSLLVIDNCDPCSFTPPYAFLNSTVPLKFPSATGSSLSSSDTMRLIPVKEGPLTSACAISDGPFGSQTFLPSTVGPGGSYTIFSVDTGRATEAENFEGSYYACYRRLNDEEYAVVSDGNGEASVFSILPNNESVITAVSCPLSGEIYSLETVTYNLTSLDPQLYPRIQFSASDEFVLVRTTALTEEGCSGIASNSPTGILAVASDDIVIPTLESFSETSSNWYVTLPLSGEATYTLCFRLEYTSAFFQISKSSEEVLAANPSAYSLVPPVVLPTTSTFSLTIQGSDLKETDEVFLVSAAEGNCVETCYFSSNASNWNGIRIASISVTPEKALLTVVNLMSSGSSQESVMLRVCYRRTNAFLTELGEILIGEQNPTAYVVSFTPRVGTRPVLTFTGKNLTSKDEIFLVNENAYCLQNNALVSGSFLDIDTSSGVDAPTWTSFYLPLNVKQGSYTVCYVLSTIGAGVPVGNLLEVLPGGPTEFASTNEPMIGRATTITFPNTTASPYEEQVGDTAYITCPECSCYDEILASVAYGNPNSTSTGTANISIRVGFSEQLTYLVCYKVTGSGYAFVQALTPLPNSPSSSLVYPHPTYQGQRLNYTFSSFTSNFPVSQNDSVMLVQFSRYCWEPVEASESGVIILPADVTEVIESTSAVWEAHIPSVGPDTPDSSIFPLNYTLCYREAGQAEFVAVPFPYNTSRLIQSPDPSVYATTPSVVQVGMIGIEVAFSTAEEGDEVYLVRYNDDSNTGCTDSNAQILSDQGAAYPFYTMNVAGDAPVGSKAGLFCYIKKGATVAEVPQLLAISSGNPSGYETNATNPEGITFRDYLAFTVRGSGLSIEDHIVFSEKACAAALADSTQGSQNSGSSANLSTKVSFLASSPLLSRLSDFSVSSDTTTVTFVAQFRNAEGNPENVNMYLCYYRDNVWVEVGSTIFLQKAEPQVATLYQVNPGSLPEVILRAGQHLQIELSGLNSLWETQTAAVISGNNSDSQSWCSNFTYAGVQEKSLAILSSGLLNVPVWLNPGSSRLCLLPTAPMPWRDAGETQYAPLLAEVFPPNPSYMEIYPSVPRVGQQVTFTFHLLVEADAKDEVKIIEDIGADTLSCFSAASLTGFDDRSLFVTVVDNVTTTLMPIDSTDPLGYRSFNASTTVRICYYSVKEEIWSVVGQFNTEGTDTLVNSSLTIYPVLPQSWKLYSGALIMGYPFQLAFVNDGSSDGDLHPDSDRVWAVPQEFNCSKVPESVDECPGCLSLSINKTLSNEMLVVTEEASSIVVDSFHLCYRLADSTAAVIPDDMVVMNASIACSITQQVIIGAQQTVIFEKKENLTVTNDTWRVSFYAANSTVGCQDNYVPQFVPERATQTEVTSTTVSYALEWPVALTDEKYVICYRHENVVGPVCTCEQLVAKNGECYLETVPGSPSSFAPMPHPTYVGETITLNLTILSEYTLYPPTAVKFVANDNPLLTTCQDSAAFVPSSPELVKQSDTLYTYTFQHDYKLGPSEVLVCALTSRTDQYVRVPSPSEGNVLLIRPFMELTTFPSLAEYIRAMQTLSLNFTHQSRYIDDVVSLQDEIFVVTDPYHCTETYINAQNPQDTMKVFDIYDTAFDTLPADVNRENSATKSTFTVVTFANGTEGTYYWCYKLANGTWAPVLPSLDILAAPVENCVLQNTTTVDNGGDTSLRAMQYIATQLSGDSTFDGLVSPGVDLVRLVPENQLCIDDNFSLYESSVVASETSGTFTTVVFSAVQGVFKICYRFGGETSVVSNWSPICSSFTVTAPTPTGDTTGCFSIHQAIEVTASQRDNFVFSTNDTFRFIPGDLPCLLPSLTSVGSSSTIDVGGEAQTIEGVSPEESGDTFSVPYALLRRGTSSFRLCYTDASGTQFAVPIQYATKPTVSSWLVSGSQPSGIGVQKEVQIGQRFFMNFTSSGNDDLPLTPYATLPDPFEFAPEFNGEFDGAGLLEVTSGVAYRDGRCIAASKAAAVSENRLGLLGVYGPISKLYTETAFAPALAGTYITCYRLAACLVADVGNTLQILPSNPGSTATVPPLPRRGQLITVEFERSTLNSSVVSLTPGEDRGIKEAGLSSCWDLSVTAGTIVQGTAQSTHFVTFFPAQPPLQSSTTSTLTCYFLVGGSWSTVPNGEQDVLPANPSGFTVSPTTARADQLIELEFSGEGFSSSDTVKILSGEEQNCSDMALPSDDIDVFDLENNTISKGGVSNDSQWPILSVSSDGKTSAFRFSSSSAGVYSVCYRLQTDVVWTLVYGTLTVASRNPSTVTMTPVAVLETELFTLQFSSVLLSNGHGNLQATDRVVLYEGSNVNCLNPGDAVSLSASPSDIRNLPDTIDFQLDCGTRGNYTVCYLATEGTTEGASVNPVRVPIWGFPSIMARPDPVAVTVFTPGLRTGDSITLRAMEVISLVFNGFGLVADPKQGKTDSVKLISALSYPTPTDNSCRDASLSPDIILLPLYANGTYSVQQFIPTTSAASSTAIDAYWVCYRLNGGQHHLIGSKVEISQTPLPSAATTTKVESSSSSTTIMYMDGEAIPWTVESNSACESVQSNYLFYSADRCGNVPYYVDSIIANAAEYFSLGYAPVNCTPGSSTLVRIEAANAIEEAFPNTNHTTTTQYNLSLCYYYGLPTSERGNLTDSFPSVTLLGEIDSIPVTFGTPAPLSSPIMTTALTNFSISLNVIPTSDDYYVLVDNPNNCYGITAPSNAALFMVPIVEAGVLTILTAVESSGIYYICYSHRSGECASDDRECARIVGEIHASGPSPSSWSGSPTPAYTTDVYEVSLRFPSTSTQGESRGNAWLTVIQSSSETDSATMKDVYEACSQPMDSKNVVISLAYNNSSQIWKALQPFSVDGQYALCYNESDSQIHFFAPLSNAGPLVSPSDVTSASWASNPVVVGVPSFLILNGGGLSTDDIVIAVKTTALGTISSDICSTSSTVEQVPANPESGPVKTGLTVVSRTFLFSVEGTYVLCYRAASLSAGAPLAYISSLGSFSVLTNSISVTVEGKIQYVGVPVVLLFSGIGLTDSDKAALTPIGDTPLDSVTEEICETSAAGYISLTNASSGAGLKTVAAIPTVSGSHVICFKGSASTSSPIILPPAVTVYDITSSAAIFITQPICYASRVCESQPAVQMRDKSGNPSSTLNAVVSLALLDSSNVNISDQAGLTGMNDYFLLDNYTTFQYLSVRINKPGTYLMKASITLPNNNNLMALSSTFEVSESTNTQNIAKLACSPAEILQSVTEHVSCNLTQLFPNAPSQYDIVVYPGSATNCESVENPSSGLSTCQFIGTPSTTEVTNYMAIYANPAAPFDSWSVLGSPTFIRIPQTPGPSTTLTCTAPPYSPPLPSADFIRQGDNLSCEVQGMATIHGIEKKIVVLPERLRIRYYINTDSSSLTDVNIGMYPEGLDGLYSFHIEVGQNTARSITVSGEVLPASSVWSSMEGSPESFFVLGQPTTGDSYLQCVSVSSGSKTFFSPTSEMTCILLIKNAEGPILGIGEDYRVSMPDGGSVITQPSSTTLGDNLSFRVSAPEQPSSVLNESYTFEFGVSVEFDPGQIQAVNNMYTLVFVTSELSPSTTFRANERATLELEGSGLLQNHSYRVSSSASHCSFGSPAVASTSDGILTVAFTVPAVSSFIICYEPIDGIQYETLLEKNFTVVDVTSSEWTTLYIVLLVIGVSLLLALLTLFILLLWRVCCARHQHHPKAAHGPPYVRPHINTRYTQPTTSSRAESPHRSPSLPSSPPQRNVEKKDLSREYPQKSNHVDSFEKSDSPPEKVSKSSSPHRNRRRHRRKHHPSNASSSFSHIDPMPPLPSVPPPSTNEERFSPTSSTQEKEDKNDPHNSKLPSESPSKPSVTEQPNILNAPWSPKEGTEPPTSLHHGALQPQPVVSVSPIEPRGALASLALPEVVLPTQITASTAVNDLMKISPLLNSTSTEKKNEENKSYSSTSQGVGHTASPMVPSRSASKHRKDTLKQEH